MTKELLYWLLMLLWLLFGAWRGFSAPAERPYVAWGLIPFLLFVVVGLALFGQPLK